MASGAKASRAAHEAPTALHTVCRKVAALGSRAKAARLRSFFESAFEPRRIGAEGSAFFTGYYEPVVEGSLVRTTDYAIPLYAAPAGLVGGAPGQKLPGLDPTLNAGRRLPDGRIVPLPDRAAIAAGAMGNDAKPLVWLSDPVDAYFVQIQGSARIRLPDGTLRRLVYAGRNGYPYTSIGKVLVQRLGIPPEQMGLTQLKAWLRDNGLGPDDPGTKLMHENRSYIFFAFDRSLPPNVGPIGGEGISLTALRSLAIDRSLWPYGLPFYVDAQMPWRGDETTPFRRLMVGQDTGSAIVGPARADIFFGSGPDAARRAGPIRHSGTLYVLWPRKTAAKGAAR